MKKYKQTDFVKEYEFTDDELESIVGGGTVKSDGEKPKIKGLEADIEAELNIINYEGKAQ